MTCPEVAKWAGRQLAVLVVGLALCLPLWALLWTVSAEAGITPCSTAAVNAGLCRAETNRLVHYDLPQAVQGRILAAYEGLHNYQDLVACQQTRAVDERGVLVAAGVDAGDCTPAQIGDEIVNPQGKAAWMNVLIRWEAFVEPVTRWESRPQEPPEPPEPDVSQ